MCLTSGKAGRSLELRQHHDEAMQAQCDARAGAEPLHTAETAHPLKTNRFQAAQLGPRAIQIEHDPIVRAFTKFENDIRVGRAQAFQGNLSV